MIKWFLRIVITGALAGAGYLAVHRKRVIGAVERTTERVDDNLKAVERKAEDVRESKEDLEDAARRAQKRTF